MGVVSSHVPQSLQASSNGTDTDGQTRTRWVILAAADGLRVVFWNGPGDNLGAGIPGTVTIRAAAEVGSIIVPIRFRGQRDIQLENNGYVVSDIIGLHVALADVLFIRTRYVVASGQKWRINYYTGGAGEGGEQGIGTTDKTLSGTITGGNGFGPLMVLGDVAASTKQIVTLGDSMIAGQGLTVAQTHRPYTRRAVDATLPYTHVAIGGMQGAHYLVADSAHEQTAEMQRAILQGATHVICEFIINDYYAAHLDLAALQALFVPLWTTMARHGAKVYQVTAPPFTTSTDSWATTTNQTPTAYNAARVAFNGWVRTTPSLLTGYFEVADTVESSRDSGKWKVDGTANKYTADGVHQTDAADILMAAAINPAVFT